MAELAPSAELCGINFQHEQVIVARRLLAGTAACLVEADFLQHEFERRFELVCLVESAFHMPDKGDLCRRIARVLAPAGEVWLLDIVIAERAANAFTIMGRDQTLFNYVPLRDWRGHFADHGIVDFEILDLSKSVADFMKVSDIKVLRDEYLLPRMSASLCEASWLPGSSDETQRSLELMVQIANEYRRTSRLLRGGMLQYVLMRWRKAG
jgi:SAM-dependent methyltransferase